MGLDQETAPGQLLRTWRVETRDALGRKVLEGLLVAGLWESTMGRAHGYWFWAAQTAEMPPHTARVAGNIFPGVGDTWLLIHGTLCQGRDGQPGHHHAALETGIWGFPGLVLHSGPLFSNSVPRHADAEGNWGPKPMTPCKNKQFGPVASGLVPHVRGRLRAPTCPVGPVWRWAQTGQGILERLVSGCGAPASPSALVQRG